MDSLSIKEDFFRYVGKVDELVGYTRSYKLVFYKSLFENIQPDGVVDAMIVTDAFKKFYLNRKKNGKVPDVNTDNIIYDIENSSIDEIYNLIIKNPVRYISAKGFIHKKEVYGKKVFEIQKELWEQITCDDIEKLLVIINQEIDLYFCRRIDSLNVATHNKLVRDFIPDIIENSGRFCDVCILEDEAYTNCLNEKLQEEVSEYLADKTIEELADILEVLHAIAQSQGYAFSEVENLRMEKKLSRGGFEKRIFLKSVIG